MHRPKQTGVGYGYAEGRLGVDSVAASAEIIVPLVVQRFQPRSVIDLGCGAGDWLYEFLRNGVTQVRGYDGNWVPKESLKVPTGSFQCVDLYAGFPEIERFDLSICLEVAEHVTPQIGERIVSFLCASSDIILWSAAIPGQGGYEHINEQPQSYWVEVFLSHGFHAFDLLRPAIWTDRKVSVWYRQNCLIFANKSAQVAHSLVQKPFITSIIHPEIFDRARDPKNYSGKAIIRNLYHYITRRFTSTY